MYLTYTSTLTPILAYLCIRGHCRSEIVEKERRVKQNYTCSRKEFCKCRTVMLNDLHGFKYLGEAGNPFPAFNHNVTFFRMFCNVKPGIFWCVQSHKNIKKLICLLKRENTFFGFTIPDIGVIQKWNTIVIEFPSCTIFNRIPNLILFNEKLNSILY